MLARDEDPKARLTRGAPLEEESVAGEGASLPFAQQSLELRLAPQPALRIETETLRRRRY